MFCEIRSSFVFFFQRLNALIRFCSFFNAFLSMAAQLTQVVERMSKANDNLSILASNNSPVPDLAGLWQESYSSSRPLSADGAASGMVREDSSLSVFATEHGL
jgi:hypothetical protein